MYNGEQCPRDLQQPSHFDFANHQRVHCGSVLHAITAWLQDQEGSAGVHRERGPMPLQLRSAEPSDQCFEECGVP